MLAKDYTSHIDFGRRIADVLVEKILDQLQVRAGTCGEHFGGDATDRMVAFDIVGILGERQSVLGQRLEAVAPVDPASLRGR